ncbi:Siderophore iron transporter mirB [Talaromyces islandicus]|uniref:Siderophore iron transporter mirB n=1 Tax=Talaromyces islandicus TaxID=28573 RepID=A0A0U1M6G1_TALIS|nr:Siderophore iron transporter mirB [Talaromyces islandicus]
MSSCIPLATLNLVLFSTFVTISKGTLFAMLPTRPEELRSSRIHNEPPQCEQHSENPAEPEGDNRETLQSQGNDDKFITSTPPTVVYMGVLLVFFICSLQQQTNNSLFVYVLSYFSGHPTVASLGLINSSFSGVFNLLFTNNLRLGSYLSSFVSIILGTSLGFVLLATSRTQAALVWGQLLCFLGYQGLFYVLDVITCDISSLDNRACLLALSRFPYIINTFVGPNLAQKIHRENSWRLAYGVFGGILPAMCAPLAVILLIESRAKAKTRVHVTPQRTNSLPLWKELGRIVHDFDCVLFWVAFVIWEAAYARRRFAAFHLLINPTVLGACVAGTILFISFYCVAAYFLSYIQVVYNTPISQAGYIYNIHTIGACCFAILAGISIRATGRFKWLAFSAMTWHLIATGLLLYFRQPKRNIAQLAVSQFLISVSGGLLGICGQMAILAADTHTGPATVLGLLFLFTSFGGAVGQAIASAIYTFYMPKALQKYLPADVQPPIRQAVIKAYSEVMRHLCVAGLCVLPVAWFSIAGWKNVNVKKAEQKDSEAT